MTLQYTPGMSLAEFEEMIAQNAHRKAVPAAPPSHPAPESVVAAEKPACQHPFDPAGIRVHAKPHEKGTAITVYFYCPACGESAGRTRKLLRK